MLHESQLRKFVRCNYISIAQYVCLHNCLKYILPYGIDWKVSLTTSAQDKVECALQL